MVEATADPKANSDLETKPVQAKSLIEDPDVVQFQFKMSNTIKSMPTEVQERFMALKNLYDQQNELDDVEETDYRLIEVKHEKNYAQVYDLRRKILSGEMEPTAELIAEFDNRAAILKDADFDAVEINPVDVKDIQNTLKGVPGFWMRAMINCGAVTRLVQEKDRMVLMHLLDISCELHEEGHGFNLTFTFEKNDYFNDLVLSKKFFMARPNVIEKTVGTVINWKDGRNITEKKVKKKVGGKKAKKTVTKTVQADSFFNFFKDATLPESKDLEKMDDEEGKDLGEKMDEDFETGNDIKDQLIPLALEYYLEVIVDSDEDEDGDDDNSDNGQDDSDDDKHAAIKSKPKGGAAKGKKGGKEECNQQ